MSAKRANSTRLSGPYLCQLPLVLLHQLWVDLDLSGLECWRGNKLKSRVTADGQVSYQGRSIDSPICDIPDELASEPQEWLLEIIIRLGGYFKVLEILLTVKCYSTGLDLPFLQVNSLLRYVSHRRRRFFTLTSTLLPQRTMGMFSQTLSRSRCQFGTFL